MQSIREKLAGKIQKRYDPKLGLLEQSSNAGLWWDKYLPLQNDSNIKEGDEVKAARSVHIRAMTETIRCPEGYREALDRWRYALEIDSDVVLAKAEAQGRIIIGIGEKGALEVGLKLHHTWGVPYLPGSALKGVAAATAHLLVDGEGWQKAIKNEDGKLNAPGDYHRFLFGTTDESGAIEFLDALWVPSRKSEKLPIHQDVMTVHHAEYYQNSDKPPAPSDTDNPNPVSFASINGTYLVALRARPGFWSQDQKKEQSRWLDIALDLIKKGLKDLGIGAKTNAGYGRMDLNSHHCSDRAAKILQKQKLEVLGSKEPLLAELDGVLSADESQGARFRKIVSMSEKLKSLSTESKAYAWAKISKEITRNRRTREKLDELKALLEQN